jgi:hypothetical protein
LGRSRSLHAHPEELDRQVRRRAVGRTIGEICRDLAVVPAFCTPAF